MKRPSARNSASLLSRFGIADEHGFRAAEIESGDRGLVGHVDGVLQHVAHRVRFVGIRPHAQAAERGTEYGVVNGDHAAQAGVAMVEEHDLLVAELAERLEEVHRCLPARGG